MARLIDKIGGFFSGYGPRSPVVVRTNTHFVLTLHGVRDRATLPRVRQLLLRGCVIDPSTEECSDEYPVLIDTGATTSSFPKEALDQIRSRAGRLDVPIKGSPARFRNADNTQAMRGNSDQHPTFFVDFAFRECHAEDGLGGLHPDHSPASTKSLRTNEYTRGPTPLACIESWRIDPSIGRMGPIHKDSSIARREREFDQQQPRYIILGMDFMHRWRLICDGQSQRYTLELL